VRLQDAKHGKVRIRNGQLTSWAFWHSLLVSFRWSFTRTVT